MLNVLRCSTILTLLPLLAGGCASGAERSLPEPVPAQEPEPPAVEETAPEFHHRVVWTVDENVQLETEYGIASIPNTLTRVEVLEVDGSRLRVRCTHCDHPLDGWLDVADVVYQPTSPEEAATADLATFALAVRQAAIERNLGGLRPVMHERFTFTFGGGGGPADAFNRWRFENYRTLDRLPVLLDRGLATYDGTVWSAPREFATTDDFHGLRAGFRQEDGRWRWLFLVEGD